jgi:hypothetical protein
VSEAAGQPGLAPRGGRAYALAFAACAFATVALLWAFKYLPMTDLPQHTSQVSVWMRYDDPAYGYADRFELNLFTPYLLGYALARAFAWVMPLLPAMKLVVTLAVLAQPAAVHYLLGRTGGDRWWSLAAFPAALGYSFRWGFLNFIVAVGPAILLIAWAVDYARRPTWLRAAALAALACVLFWAHLLLMAFACCAAGLVIACHAWRERIGFGRLFVRLLPLAVPLPLVLMWLTRDTHADPAGAGSATVWGLSLRRVGIPMLIVSNPWDVAGAIAGTVLVLLLAVALFARGGGLRAEAVDPDAPERRRGIDRCAWMPAVAGIATYLLLPHRVMGVVFLWQRFGSITFVLATAAARPPASPRVRAAVRAGVLVVAFAWLALLAWRFSAFNRSAADFDRVVAVMEPHRQVLSRIRSRDAIGRGDSNYLHFAEYYVAAKGGLAVYSPAFQAHALARFRPGRAPPHMHPEFPWDFDEFSFERHGGYDYVLVRSPGDPAAAVFKRDVGRMRLAAREGAWWLYVPAGGAG